MRHRRTSNGKDYGWYDSAATNAAIVKAYDEPDTAKRNAMWGDVSEQLAKEVAYVPIGVEKWLRLHGSGVTNYSEGPALGQIGTAGRHPVHRAGCAK
jgi:peptide/nickel transport system substrate-binding protein